MKEDCIFCRIVNGRMPGTIVEENELVAAINDINPQAPHHILIIPKKHIVTVEDIKEVDERVVYEMMKMVGQIVSKTPSMRSGYRLVINNGAQAGQSVGHLHMHLLSGRAMQWPPG